MYNRMGCLYSGLSVRPAVCRPHVLTPPGAIMGDFYKVAYKEICVGYTRQK